MKRSTQLRPVRDWTGRATLALALLTLAGCGDYSADYPDLMPTDQLLAEPALPAHAAGSEKSPLALETGLIARAKGAGHHAPSHMDTGDLAARAQALQSRAKALSQTPMGDDEVTDCPPDATDCPTPTTAPVTP